MRIARYTAVAVAALIYLAGSSAQAQFWGDIPLPDGVSVIYDPVGGNLGVSSSARTVTTFEAKSAGNLFVPDNIAAGVLLPPFDLITPEKLFKLSAGDAAYASIEFGNVLPAGLTADAVAADMTISGSLTPDGSGNNALDANGFSLIVVPEPSSVLLLGLGLLGVLGLRRRS